MSASETGPDDGLKAGAILVRTVEDSGLIDPGSPGIALLSGGPDSVAMLAGLVGLSPDVLPVALHVNYGLRNESGEDQAACVEVCRRLGVELVVKKAGPPVGNVQAWARDLRYAAAEELRADRAAEWIAVGHTMSDVAETVIYRLASSPGRRALAAMSPRSGKVVRPLLGLGREDTRSLAISTGLPFVDDRTNDDPAFARVRIRKEVMPVLKELNPGASANITRTREELLEEGELLEGLAAGLVAESVQDGGQLPADALADTHPALRRLAIRHLAETELGRQVPVPIGLAAEAWRLVRQPEGGSVDLGGGASLVMEAGTISIDPGNDPTVRPAGPGESELNLPGEVLWNGWAVTAELLETPFTAVGNEAAALDLDSTGNSLTIRSWQPGDRMQPLGMEGSKTLQDLFTDRGVPRTKRHRIPVLARGEDIIWVAGVALGHRYRLLEETRRAVLLRAVRA